MTKLPNTTADQLEQVLTAAAAAAPAVAAALPAERAAWIFAAADSLDAAADRLVPLAVEESALPEQRLRGEIARSSGQLRLFAEALAEGALHEPIIDTADPDAEPIPRPDLRRMLVPLGPVLVFAASNFPFAFSVCGGDTASALAAGCPVLVKSHPGHPRLSEAVAEVMVTALREAGAPEGTLAVVHGDRVGVEALGDPRIKASGFTGSVAGGLALHEVAANRPDPIPFYGELGSLNPAFVLTGALEERRSEIAAGFVASYTLGVGQFCTKPGLLLLPTGHGLEKEIVAAAEDVAAAPMLNERIHQGYTAGLARLRARDGLEALVTGDESEGGVSASLFKTTVPRLIEDAAELLEECFGPTSIVVEYADDDELYAAASLFRGNLTATVHGSDDDADVAARLLPLLEGRAGRVVWNGWPTGVAVSWAMQHGGPFPATVGSIHTSVGTTAARRFQRPVCFQNIPGGLLPELLRDRNSLNVSRRVNGEITRRDITS
ncbi:aldehyde dehydrogenase (NADP(+)) [Nocardioides sp.]|uniref:aldehyde dehydrogenase (NADP(+)) n=1 Tax=Nocardioides sp. TaxID=35761 RepID=UPI002D8076B0|nr:aldehyde dehydrogenase (NADP(+)) [Nocardioides sp.]HET8960869.1 aldehyde dehydrogenase (NADP(+)) [Nocardioides sp.]